MSAITRSLTYWSQDLVRTMLKGMRNYPPERPGQRYRRTGKLGGSWGTRQAGRLQRSIYNTAVYSVYVVGNAEGSGQAWMHRGRWWLARRRILSYVPSLVHRIELRIKNLLENGQDLRGEARSLTQTSLRGPFA